MVECTFINWLEHVDALHFTWLFYFSEYFTTKHHKCYVPFFQADVCHAYHVLKDHGVKEENIIVMMYDDIAYNEE